MSQERIDRLADGIVNGASQYQVSSELTRLGNAKTEEDVIYYNFLLSILATFDEYCQQEH